MEAVCWQAGYSRSGAAAARTSRRPTARALAVLGEWRRRIRDRAELAALDDRMLSDIGITRADAEFLSRKPFWRE
jgi:uncharacterized protein YjiS (DUF1127 family)